MKTVDPVSHPAHYTSHPSGIECIQVTEHMSFCLGNAVKYIWRAGLKAGDGLEDLRKSAWYIQREIQRREVTSVAEKKSKKDDDKKKKDGKKKPFPPKKK